MLEKIPKIDFYVGQKCLVIGGVKCEDQESTPRMHVRPGDLVEVVASINIMSWLKVNIDLVLVPSGSAFVGTGSRMI